MIDRQTGRQREQVTDTQTAIETNKTENISDNQKQNKNKNNNKNDSDTGSFLNSHEDAVIQISKQAGQSVDSNL